MKVTRTQLIVVTVLVFLGLMGPMAYFFQGDAEQTQQQQTTQQQPSQPKYLVPVEEYSTEATMEVLSVDPFVSAIANSDYANTYKIKKRIEELPGVTNTTVDQSTNDDGYQYTIFVQTNDSSLLEEITYRLRKELPELNFVQLASRAKLDYPSEVDVDGKTINLLSAKKLALVFPYTKEGTNSTFQLKISTSTQGTEVTAIEQPKMYIPPVNIVSVNTTGTITNITSYKIGSEVDFQETVPIKNKFNVSVDTTTNMVTQFKVNTSNATLLQTLVNDSYGGGQILNVNFGNNNVSFEDKVLEVEEAAQKLGLDAKIIRPTRSYVYSSSKLFSVWDSIVQGNETSRKVFGTIETPETLANYTLESNVFENQELSENNFVGEKLDLEASLSVIFGYLEGVSLTVSQ